MDLIYVNNILKMEKKHKKKRPATADDMVIIFRLK